MAMYVPGRQRKALCIFYEKGWCKNGDSCRFTHGTSDTREMMGSGIEGAAGEPATIHEPCRFFAIGTCSKGSRCPFLHSSYSVDEAHRRETLAHGRCTKRPAAATLISPRYQPAGATRLGEEEAGADTAAEQPRSARRGVLTVTKQDMLPLGGGDTGESDPEDEPGTTHWGDEDRAYFYGAPGGFDGAGTSTTWTEARKTADRNGGSWHDVVRGNPESSVMDKGKPPAKVGATDNALPSSAPDEAGVKTKPASDQARAARAAVAIASFLNTSLSSPRAGERKVCSFFLRGCCRFGDNCRNSHKVDLVENASDFVENTVGGEVKVGRANLTEAKRGAGDEKEDLAPKEAALDEVERIQTRKAECGICLERVKDRFGILVGCRHSYCLKCIREWRRKSQKRNCPECGIQSHFVVPSSTLVTDPQRKEQLVSTYKEHLSTIPCQHFEYGVSECPFGSSCFYAHLKKDGTPAFPETPRIRWSATGDSEAVREVHLSSFFDPRL